MKDPNDPDDPKDPTQGMHRKGGHTTSRDAALAILSKRTALQRIVFAKLIAAGPRGLTLYEIEEQCGDHSSTMRTRCSELVAQRLVVDAKTKRMINGRDRKVWRVRTPADDADADLVDLMQGGKVDPLQALLGRGFHTAFANTDEVDAYIRANGFRYVGDDGTHRIFRTLKGHRFSYDPSATPIVGELSWQTPDQNRGDGDRDPIASDADADVAPEAGPAAYRAQIPAQRMPETHQQNP